MKYKVLFYGDSPCSTTGFGRVNKVILDALADTGLYEIDAVVVNHYASWYDPSVFRYRLHDAIYGGDQMGVKMMGTLLQQNKYDLVIVHNDFAMQNHLAPLILEARKQQNFKWLAYAPLDC